MRQKNMLFTKGNTERKSDTPFDNARDYSLTPDLSTFQLIIFLIAEWNMTAVTAAVASPKEMPI